MAARPKTKMIPTIHLPNRGYPDSMRLNFLRLASLHGSSSAASITGVSASSAYAWQVAMGVTPNQQSFSGNQQNTAPLRDYSYKIDEQYRLRACRLAMSSSVQVAANLFKVTERSVRNWLKAYNMQTAYWNRNSTVATK
jgi:hypothetical protein